MYPEELSNCGCPQEPTTPPVAPPAPPVCNNGEPCEEVINTTCVRYDGPDIPGVAATGDNMTEVLQGLSNNGNIGGANNFTLQPADSTVSINGASNPVVVDTPGQVITLSAVGAVGPPGAPGETLSALGVEATYQDIVDNHPTPAVLDAYLTQDNGEFWVYDPSSSAANGDGWVNMGSIQGPQGLPGASGPAGNLILSGSTNPLAALGNVGDYYLNTTTNTLIGPKQLSGWPVAGVSLVGPAGQNGATGATGATGPAGLPGSPGAPGTPGAPGADGSKIFSGTTTPSPSLGAIGDYYLNTTTYTLIGPKTGAGWPGSGLLLKGADGASGLPGANGAPGAQGPAGADGGAKILDFINVTSTSNNTIAGTMTSDMLLVNTTVASVTINVPNLDNTTFPIGMQLIVAWDTWDNDPPATTVTFAPVGSAVIRSANSMLKLRTRYSTATLIKQAQNGAITTWYLAGDLMP